MFHKFWTQFDIDWCMKSANSGSCELCSEMEWLVYCIVLEIGFHSKSTKWLLPQYYDVPKVLDSIRYRLVEEIRQFRFVRSSFWNGMVSVLLVLAIRFRSKLIKWLLPQHYDAPQVLDLIWYQLVHEIGQFRFVRRSLLNGVVGVLHSSRDWISLKTHQMTPPTILRYSPSFGLNPI